VMRRLPTGLLVTAAGLKPLTTGHQQHRALWRGLEPDLRRYPVNDVTTTAELPASKNQLPEKMPQGPFVEDLVRVAAQASVTSELFPAAQGKAEPHK
jgi:hypothetical protein